MDQIGEKDEKKRPLLLLLPVIQSSIFSRHSSYLRQEKFTEDFFLGIVIPALDDGALV